MRFCQIGFNPFFINSMQTLKVSSIMNILFLKILNPLDILFLKISNPLDIQILYIRVWKISGKTTCRIKNIYYNFESGLTVTAVVTHSFTFLFDEWIVTLSIEHWTIFGCILTSCLL